MGSSGGRRKLKRCWPVASDEKFIFTNLVSKYGQKNMKIFLISVYKEHLNRSKNFRRFMQP